MKLLTELILFLTVSLAFTLPAGDPNDDAEFVPVSRRQQHAKEDTGSDSSEIDFKDFKGVVDTESGHPFFTFRPYNPFGTSFFDNFEDIFRRMRESLLNRWWSAIPEDLDPSKGNTTSIVKVVDGHKVEINDTVYTKEDETGNALFKVRVVNIRPLDSEEDATTSGPPINKKNTENDKGSPEILEKNNEDNEVFSNTNSAESTLLRMPPTKYSSLNDVTKHNLSHINVLIELNSNENNQDDNGQINNFNITTKDAAINKTTSQEFDSYSDEIENERDLIEKSAYKVNDFDETAVPPKVYLEDHLKRRKEKELIKSELSDEVDSDTRNYDNYEWENFQIDDNHDNIIDAYQSIPIDLSNDIAINEMLADQGAPTNPDAEVFSVDEFLPEYQRSRLQNDAVRVPSPLWRSNYIPIK